MHCALQAEEGDQTNVPVRQQQWGGPVLGCGELPPGMTAAESCHMFSVTLLYRLSQVHASLVLLSQLLLQSASLT